MVSFIFNDCFLKALGLITNQVTNKNIIAIAYTIMNAVISLQTGSNRYNNNPAEQSARPATCVFL